MADAVIQKKPVYARNEQPSRLYGMFTVKEFFILIGVFFAMLLTFHKFLLAVGIDAAFYLYFRKVKSLLPERIIRSFIKFKLRPYSIHLWFITIPAIGYTYRSGGRDTSWRPPIIAD